MLFKQEIVMGWFKTFFEKKDTFLKKEDIIAELIIRDEKYVLEQIDIEFKRDKNLHGMPESEVYGGFITCILSGFIGKQLLAWVVYNDRKEEGNIRFYNRTHNLQQGATFTLKFMDANCISFSREVNNQKKKRTTKLVIAPHILKIGNEEFINEWRK